MIDDWRVHAQLENEIGAGRLLKGMHEREIVHDVEDQLESRLPVSVDDRDVFVYTAARAQAEAAASAVADVLSGHGLDAVVTITHWHPIEQAWKAADEPLPVTPAEQAAEHARMAAREARESAERGAQWEVRIDLDSRADAIELADQLGAQGLTLLRRWKHVFVELATADEAHALADRLQATGIAAEQIIVEGAPDDAWRATHPYAVLGGLGN